MKVKSIALPGMSKASKKRWIAALRSGEYIQGQTYLCKETTDGLRWCCLGVLIDNEVEEDWEYTQKERPYLGGALDKKTTGVWQIGESRNMPSRPMRKILGLTSLEADKLAAWNDDYAASFGEIADRIEKGMSA